jgi:hypothetical protein
MPTFDTPEPISVTVELSMGELRIVASERTDTVVEVRPTNSSQKGDVSAAQQTRVEFADGKLLVKGPKGWRPLSFLGGRESIDVEIALPAGSELRGDAAAATVRTSGRLGDCRFKTAAGNMYVAETGPVQLKTSAGDITVEHASGDAELTTSSGSLRIDRVDGNAVLKNSNGDTRLGEITKDLRVSSANGSIAVERAGGTVVAKTANGNVRLAEVGGGAVQVDTARGGIEVGVIDGTAAWLDLKTQFGTVRNTLDAAGKPDAGEHTVEVRASTAFGDITISRVLAHGAKEKR